MLVLREIDIQPISMDFRFDADYISLHTIETRDGMSKSVNYQINLDEDTKKLLLSLLSWIQKKLK